jgi:hypothetical protein
MFGLIHPLQESEFGIRIVVTSLPAFGNEPFGPVSTADVRNGNPPEDKCKWANYYQKHFHQTNFVPTHEVSAEYEHEKEK